MMETMEHIRLREEVERVAGMQVRTNGDFGALADKVWRRTGVLMSATTLKRMWGYLREDVQPRPTTLDALARFVGYADYASFCNATGQVDSNPILSRHITDRDLRPGQRVCLMWHPGRRLVARHEGQGRFTVVESENAKLSVGDTFSCRLMIEREPLYMEGVAHLGQPATCFVAGRMGGITFEVME